jgi:hypothetical protein
MLLKTGYFMKNCGKVAIKEATGLVGGVACAMNLYRYRFRQ